MLRTLSILGASLGVLMTASLASAQGAPAQATMAKGFGQQGEFIFSADRLMPLFAYTNQRTAQPTLGGQTSVTNSQNQTNVSFFMGGTPPNQLFYTVPRVGFDYTIVDNVTIGGNLIFYFTPGGSLNTHAEFNDGHTSDSSQSAASTTIFGFAPRGGYVLGLNDMFALWLRGGFSYYNQTVSADVLDASGNKQGTQSNTNWVLALDLDPQFVVVPLQHFAFTVGPSMDIPLVGKNTQGASGNGMSSSTSFSYSQFGFGINAGLMGWIGG